MHSLVFHVILQFIPVYGTLSLQASFTTVSLVIGAFCILNVFGNLIAGNAIHRGISPSRLIQLQFVVAPILGLIVFTSNFPDVVKLGTILWGFFHQHGPNFLFYVDRKTSRRASRHQLTTD